MVCDGSVPASAVPSCMYSAGMAKTHRTPTTASAAALGWRATARLSRAMAPESGSAVSRRRLRNGTRPRSMRCPTLARIAGSRVTAVITATITVMAVPRPSLVTNGIPMSMRPEIEIATVSPAKITARPAVVPAVTAALTGRWPSARAWRKRVTMKSA